MKKTTARKLEVASTQQQLRDLLDASTMRECVTSARAILADRERLQALVVEARDIFLVHRDDTTTEAMVDDWLARTAPKPKEQS